jgi:hypothetical protein
MSALLEGTASERAWLDRTRKCTGPNRPCLAATTPASLKNKEYKVKKV